jgi:type IX secretion system PorP/SprF family membrane protein
MNRICIIKYINMQKLSRIQKASRVSGVYFAWLKGGLLFITLLVGMSVRGQQDPLFTQYMFNKLVVNPAYAGSRELLTIDILNRTQWVGIDGAPQTLTFGAHMPMRNRKVAVGFYGYRDALGPTVNQGLMGTYAYRLIFPEGTFSFGLQAGLKYFNFDWNMIRVKDPDYYFYPRDVQRFYPDVNLGVYYQSSKYFAGLSSKQLLENEYGVITHEDGNNSFSRLLRHFYLMGGAIFPLDEKIAFRPSLLAKYVKNAPMQVDLNASMLFNNVFWIGASYRTEKAIAFLTEFRITDKIRLGYSYDIYFNELQPHNYGSHEIRLGFDVNVYDFRMKTPRYF